MGLYDNELAAERQRVALETANMTPGRGGVFLAARGAERMNQGVRGLMGIEEPVVTEAKAAEAKQAKLNSILSSFQSDNMKTRADYQKAVNELYAAGFPEYAAKIVTMMKDLPDPNKKPETYNSNDGVRYLTSGVFNGEAYQRGDLVAGETKKVDSIQTFTQNGVVYNAITQEPMIEGSVPKVETFEQGGVVYNAGTLQPLLKGSEEDRPTFVENGLTYYLDDGSRVTEAVAKREKLLQGGVWRYVDNSDLVFPKVTNAVEPNQQAANILANFNVSNPGEFNTQEGKVKLALELINNKVANSQIFTNIMSSIDQDGVNAIQQENLIIKAVERLSENYVKSEISKMDSILLPIEQQINQFMPHLTDADGNFIYDRQGNALRDTSQGIPGWNTLKRYERYVGNSETVRQAKNFAEDAQLLINTVIKQRSGSAVSIQEADRLTKEYETGLASSESFANWVSAVRKLVETERKDIVSGFMPEVQYKYFSQMGIYPTLYDPDEDLKALPVGAKWRDESGQLHIKRR